MVGAFRGDALGWGGQQPADVLDHHEPGLQCLDRGGHVGPEPSGRARSETGALADRRYGLAGEPAAEDVHRLDRMPVDGGDVPEVRRLGPVVGEDAGDGFIEFREPDGLGVEDVLDGEVEPAVPGEQRPTRRRCPSEGLWSCMWAPAAR